MMMLCTRTIIGLYGDVAPMADEADEDGHRHTYPQSSEAHEGSDVSKHMIYTSSFSTYNKYKHFHHRSKDY